MYIVKKAILCAVGMFCIGYAGAEIIPASKLERPSGCIKTGEDEYRVGVARRANISNTTAGMVFAPDVRKIAGKVVRFSADMRCNEIASDAEGNHVGGKILVVCKDSAGRLKFYGTKPMTGTVSDWQNQSVTVPLPVDAKEVSVTFGIQQGWGQLGVRKPGMDILTCGLPEDGAKTPIPLELIVLDSAAKRNGDILSVKVPKRANMPNMTPGGVINLDLENICGKTIKVSGQVRCYNVGSNAKGGHVGAKLGAAVIGQDKRTGWLGSPSLTGSSDGWQDISLKIPVKKSAEAVRIFFGIQQAWGKAEFRNLALEAVNE